MECQKCKETMTFVNMDKRNGLVGQWMCTNVECKKQPIVDEQ